MRLVFKLRACLGARLLPQLDSFAEIKSAPSVAKLNLAEFGVHHSVIHAYKSTQPADKAVEYLTDSY